MTHRMDDTHSRCTPLTGRVCGTARAEDRGQRGESSFYFAIAFIYSTYLCLITFMEIQNTFYGLIENGTSRLDVVHMIHMDPF